MSALAKAFIRTFDIGAALLLLGLAALPMLAIAVAIRISDHGPALFRQTRVGRGGAPFTVYKFRTMSVDGGALGSGTASQPGESMAAAHERFQRTVPGDRRVTRMGRLLRPSHLDELPQLINILLGDMSFVGVRPDTPVQELDYDPAYWLARHRHKPGLTGPAQLRSDPLTLAERSAEERKWLEGYGVRSYFAILLRTAGKITTRSSF